MLLVAPHSRVTQIAWRPMCQNTLGFTWLGLTRFLCKVAISTSWIKGRSAVQTDMLVVRSFRMRFPTP